MTERSSDKLQALGLLAAGVAHDFNNLLSIIEGYGYILQQRLGNTPAQQDKISAILNATQRGAELTHLLLDFSNPSDQTSPSDLIETVNRNKPILRALLSSRIDIEYQLPRTKAMVDATSDDIVEQMIVLASHIGNTITETGSITVTAHVTPDEATLFFANNANDAYVSKVFDCQNENEHNNLRNKTILIVDDEEALLPVLEYQLENMGLKVLKAANADTALLLQKNYPDAIDFLLTDVVMPDVGGVELAGMISDHRPRMGVVYMTGNSKIDMPESSLVLPKPLRPETLSQALQKALEKVTDA
jgi:CheY-like chemotaxis protein